MAVTGTTGVDQTQRFIFVYDRQSNGAAPAITDVLDSNSPFSLFNKDNAQRFRIVADFVKVLNASVESGSTHVTGIVRTRLETPVLFNSGTAGTIADINTGGLFLLSLGSSTAGATAGTIVGRVCVNFTDA
jgi:hypothetical protein